jgi:osmotically-inducible protein OsmY
MQVPLRHAIEKGEAAQFQRPLSQWRSKMSDRILKQAVEDELSWEPSVNAEHIGVAVDDGIVTLTGHVGSYTEKYAAENAVKRVKSVRGIAQEIEVRFPNDKKTSDDQIAKRALDIIAWDSTIPKDKVQVKVQGGFVTLSGEVEWFYQRDDAEKAVRKLAGIKGILNDIKIRSKAQASDIKSRIETALKRNAELEADAIRVSVFNGRVTLDGKVKAWYERDLAERTAWSAPGVVAVEDHINIA